MDPPFCMLHSNNSCMPWLLLNIEALLDTWLHVCVEFLLMLSLSQYCLSAGEYIRVVSLCFLLSLLLYLSHITSAALMTSLDGVRCHQSFLLCIWTASIIFSFLLLSLSPGCMLPPLPLLLLLLLTMSPHCHRLFFLLFLFSPTYSSLFSFLDLQLPVAAWISYQLPILSCLLFSLLFSRPVKSAVCSVASACFAAYSPLLFSPSAWRKWR